MKIKLLLLSTLLSGAVLSHAQTTLAPGDISIIGYNSDVTNSISFAFVSWVQLNSSTVIHFTDNAFNSNGVSTGAGNYRNGEQTLTWTADANVPPGTVITISGLPMTANVGTVSAIVSSNGSSTSNLGLTNGGDQIFAFQGGTIPTTTSGTSTLSGTVVYGIGWQGALGTATNWLSTGSSSGATSYLPSTLASANVFLAGSSSSGGQYNGVRNNQTNAQFKAAVMNPANWSLTGTVSTYNTAAFTNTPLYVELTSFTARKEQTKVGLYWNTASEHENTGFDIERSADGKTYKSIGHVATKAIDGNSHSELSYSFSDDMPLNGTNIYRLAQKDKTGKVTYSATSTVQFDKSSDFVVYPNPVKGTLHLQYSSDRDDLFNVAITDISGKTILNKQLSVKKGMNNATVDASGLTQGVYYISVFNQQGMAYSTRILKD